MSQHIFVPAIGQYENIGDIMLRRPLLEWLRGLGILNVYLGSAPKGYVEALRLQAEDIAYESFSAWYAAAVSVAVQGRAHYVFKPGEIQLSIPGMKEHVGMLPLLALIRLRGGRVARVGAGSRNFAPLPKFLIKPSLALSEFVAWRDQATATYLGKGYAMPDLAFSGGDSPCSNDSSGRRTLVVSMRGDRESVPTAWIEGVREYAARHQLRIVAVTQVARDSEMSRFLARQLKAELLDWEGTAHAMQEERLRAVYREACVAVSDRLHVLIAAFTYGAIPVGLLTTTSDKIDRHFLAVGIPEVSVHTAALNAQGVMDAIAARVARRAEFFHALQQGRERLMEIRSHLLRYLAEGSQDFIQAEV